MAKSKTVNSVQVVNPNPNTNVLEKEAHTWFNTKCGAFAPKDFVYWPILVSIAEILGRAIKLQELKLLVWEDGEEEVEAFPIDGSAVDENEKKMFRPFGWLQITPGFKAFFDALSLACDGENPLGQAIDATWPWRCGSFFVPNGGREMIAVYGSTKDPKSDIRLLAESRLALIASGALKDRCPWGETREDILSRWKKEDEALAEEERRKQMALEAAKKAREERERALAHQKKVEAERAKAEREREEAEEQRKRTAALNFAKRLA